MSILIEGLPNDIALECLARVPYYLFPKLETVSHSWWAAVHSTEFYKARQAVNSSESLLCVCTLEPKNIWQLYDPIHDIWLTLPVLPSEGRNLDEFGVVSVSGKLFVLGGRNNPVASDQDETSKNEVWAYDPIFRQWAQRAPMIVPRRCFACCVWNGKILVAGGLTASRKSTWKAEIYDPDTDTWDPISDLEHTRDSACIGFVIDGVVHVVNKALKEVQVLENLEDKWQRSHPLNHALITVVNGSLYGMDYYRGGGIYKLQRGTWKVVAPASHLIYNRIGYAMVGFRDDIYVIGGFVGKRASIKPISDVDVLLLGKRGIKAISDIEPIHDSACIGFVIDGAVHVVNKVTTEVQVLENLEDKWQRSHSLNHRLITVVNGSLYGMNYYDGDIYKLEHGIWKVVASVSELNNRIGYAMVGFRDDIYVIGGFVGKRASIKPISDVDVLLLGNRNQKPVWKKVASMTRCQGFIRGCAELTI